MNSHTLPVALSLGAIVITGVLGIRLITQIGVPTFLIYASYAIVALFLLMIPVSLSGRRWGYLINIVLAATVMLLNSASSAHMGIILSTGPLYNAMILITGAYILQPILIVTSVRAFRFHGSKG